MRIAMKWSKVINALSKATVLIHLTKQRLANECFIVP